MSGKLHLVQEAVPFGESIIWQLNREFYDVEGPRAWSTDIVPHNMTSSAKVGETYAELLFALLQDLADKKQVEETLYIMELGAGHGRLAFHVLHHLSKLVAHAEVALPEFCYILTDVVEENLDFFLQHPQFQHYLREGKLDVSYCDATHASSLKLRYEKKTIDQQSLNQPIVVLANYLFDSIPTDLLYIDNNKVSTCSVAIHSGENPAKVSAEVFHEQMELGFSKGPAGRSAYNDPVFNTIVDEYREKLSANYLFFPKQALECIANLKLLSSKGLILLTMDKGNHRLEELVIKCEPEVVRHGSFSLLVNYHAIASYCKLLGGEFFFSEYSNFHLEIGCLLFVSDPQTYTAVAGAYESFVNDFGPDDYISLKHLVYKNVTSINLRELIALFRFSAYDSTFFMKFTPRLKQLIGAISTTDRLRLAQTFDLVWERYLHIEEQYDLAYEIGAMLYDIGYYQEGLKYFDYSAALFGPKADTYYNQALSYYQLRQDKEFRIVLAAGRLAYPNFEPFDKLDGLDMR